MNTTERTYSTAALLDPSELRNIMRLALACDERIPASCTGYVSQLCSDQATRAVQLDAVRMLSRFVTFN